MQVNPPKLELGYQLMKMHLHHNRCNEKENDLIYVKDPSIAEEEFGLFKCINDAVLKIGEKKNEYKQIDIPLDELEEMLQRTKINVKDLHQQTVLHLAVQYCSVDFVRRLLTMGSDARQVDCDGLTPAHYCAIAGRVDTLELLPQELLNVVDSKSSRLPLHYAAICGRVDVVKYLLERNYDIEALDSYGNTPLALAARFANPVTAQYLISEGANAEIVNSDGIPVLTVVNQQYTSLGNSLFDRYVTKDHFTGKTHIHITPMVETTTKAKGYTIYQNLIRCNRDVTDHIVLCNITKIKWNLFAKKYFVALIISMKLFSIFWTILYTWPVELDGDPKLIVITSIIMFLAGCSIIIHSLVVAYVTYKTYSFSNGMAEIIRSTYSYEKGHLHHLTKYKLKQLIELKTLQLGHTTIISVIMFMIANLIRNIILVAYLMKRLLGFVNDSSAKHDMDVIAVDIGMSLIILTTWIQMFNACDVSSRVGQFIVFTREVISDVARVFSVYIALYIPMVVIFHKTIYSHSKDAELDWYDTMFNVMRMTIIDYDYELGRDAAENVGIGWWWDILSLTWLCLSGLIIINLFIALMADRYSHIGERANIICNRKRTDFVFICELLMGPKAVDKYDNIIARNYSNISVEQEHSDKLDKELSFIKEKLISIEKKLDQKKKVSKFANILTEKMTSVVKPADKLPISEQLI